MFERESIEQLFPPGFFERLDKYKEDRERLIGQMIERGELPPTVKRYLPGEIRRSLMEKYGLVGILSPDSKGNEDD